MDIKTPEGKEIMEKLIRGADALVASKTCWPPRPDSTKTVSGIPGAIHLELDRHPPAIDYKLPILSV